jgi:hypothetical protein
LVRGSSKKAGLAFKCGIRIRTDGEQGLKENAVNYLVAVAIVVSFLATVTLAMSRVYARGLDSGRVPSDWADDGGRKSRIYRGIKSSADGNWKPLFKKIWIGFLILDLIGIVVVLIA